MRLYDQAKSDNLELVMNAVSGTAPSVDGSFAGKPLLLWLESTSRCNLRCSKCGHAYEPPDTPRILPRNLSDAVVDGADEYFAAAVKVRVSGYGEMFLYSRLRSLVERVKHHGCWVDGTTNGVVIDRSEIDWVVDLGWDQLVFSIDGAEPETMQRLRGADLNKIWDILQYIKERKEQLNTPKPQIVVGFVAQSDNVHELPALVRKLSQLNICFLAVNTLHYGGEEGGTGDIYGKLYREYSLANLDRRRVEAFIEEGRILADQANIGYGMYIDFDKVYGNPGDENQLVTIKVATDIKPSTDAQLKPYYCVNPWISLFVAARGAARVCCFMAGDVGEVAKSGDLDRVWNGDAIREIRSAIARGEVHPQCEYCVSRNRHTTSYLDLNGIKDVLTARLQTPQSGNAAARIPAVPIFGYVDTRQLRAPSGGRLRVSGWIASGPEGVPVQAVKLRLNGHELGAITQFYARPDVAAYYGSNKLLYTGWRIWIDLPRVKPGGYQLIVEGTDPSGNPGYLEPLPIEVHETEYTGATL